MGSKRLTMVGHQLKAAADRRLPRWVSVRHGGPGLPIEVMAADGETVLVLPITPRRALRLGAELIQAAEQELAEGG